MLLVAYEHCNDNNPPIHADTLAQTVLTGAYTGLTTTAWGAPGTASRYSGKSIYKQDLTARIARQGEHISHASRRNKVKGRARVQACPDGATATQSAAWIVRLTAFPSPETSSYRRSPLAFLTSRPLTSPIPLRPVRPAASTGCPSTYLPCPAPCLLALPFLPRQRSRPRLGGLLSRRLDPLLRLPWIQAHGSSLSRAGKGAAVPRLQLSEILVPLCPGSVSSSDLALYGPDRQNRHTSYTRLETSRQYPPPQPLTGPSETTLNGWRHLRVADWTSHRGNSQQGLYCRLPLSSAEDHDAGPLHTARQ
jgi:hypothetical protein